MDTDIDAHNFADTTTENGRVTEISDVSNPSAISAQYGGQRKPSALNAMEKTEKQNRSDATPDVSAHKVAELDKNNMQHRLFAQFLKDDADNKLG